MLFEKELKKIYDEHFEKCQKCNACNVDKLIEKSEKHYLYSYAAKVGENYEDQKIKVLVIGQEQPNEREDKFSPPSNEAHNHHWKRTLLTIAKCLKYDDNNILNTLEENKDMTELHKLASDFAFTNIYKCAFSKDDKWSGSSVMHSKSMANECSQLFLKELDVLKPDLIIKQGKWNSDQIEKAISNDGSIKLYKNKAINISLYKYNYFSNKPLYVIYAYHPTCQNPNWYKHKDALYECIDYFKNETQKRVDYNA